MSDKHGPVDGRRPAKLTPIGLVVVLLVTFFAWLATASPAAASNGKPANHDSYYVTNAGLTSGDEDEMYDDGVGKGEGAAQGETEPFYLDFGDQISSKETDLVYPGEDVTYADIEMQAENFMTGWQYGVDSESNSGADLELGIGTNNSYTTDTEAWGTDWAAVVNNIATWASGNGFTDVIVYGANDIESWGTRSDAEAWVNGFDGHDLLYWDYGSADGCTLGSGDQGCSGSGWTYYWYWWMSWGNSAATAVPEIYYPNQGQQWADISRYGIDYQSSGPIDWIAPLDEYPVCMTTNDSQQAWDDLKNDSGVSPEFSMGIEYEDGYIGC
jgi:hypothetical protein